jgi:patatin-like phospholipase/acyl hydrolase
MFRILSIDGGGIRGVIPAMVLTAIEEKAGRPIADLFDLIAGTSTGGIIAVGLAVRDDRGKPRFSAADMLTLYRARGREIFERSFWDGIVSVGGALDERYRHANLERILKEYLGDATLADCQPPIMVTSYDIERRQPYFFKSRKAGEEPDRNHHLRDVARATSAAPTYFEPARVESFDDLRSERILVDGGVFANNPAMCAYVEAGAHGAAPDDVLLVSLGTGIATRKIPYDDARGWGALQWARPIIGVMMDGVADAVDYQLSQLLPGRDAGDRQRYFRFDKELVLALDDMDAANAGNIKSLMDEARSIIETQGSELDRLVRLLLPTPAPDAVV